MVFVCLLCYMSVCFVFCYFVYLFFFFFKQKTAYEMRISDWSSDVCSSDLIAARRADLGQVIELGLDGKVGVEHAATGARGARDHLRQTMIGLDRKSVV